MVYYAIGDIHGELEQLKTLHRVIDNYHQEYFAGMSQVRIHLGDYVDRGPNSYGVIEYVMQLSRRTDVTWVNLKGNHESMLLDALTTKSELARQVWLRNGGDSTLQSYTGRGCTTIPEEHINWLKALPSQHVDIARKLIFVHAGIDPHRFPFGNDKVHLWTRSPEFLDSQTWSNPELNGARVVHGHTPTADFQPFISADGRRINVDTGAVYKGFLSAAVIADNHEIKFLNA